MDEGIFCRNLDCTNIAHHSVIDELSSQVVEACLSAADESIPSSTKPCGRRKVVPGWSDEVESYRQDALFWHAIWK